MHSRTPSSTEGPRKPRPPLRARMGEKWSEMRYRSWQSMLDRAKDRMELLVVKERAFVKMSECSRRMDVLVNMSNWDDALSAVREYKEARTDISWECRWAYTKRFLSIFKYTSPVAAAISMAPFALGSASAGVIAGVTWGCFVIGTAALAKMDSNHADNSYLASIMGSLARQRAELEYEIRYISKEIAKYAFKRD
jgi:hypothetical protein